MALLCTIALSISIVMSWLAPWVGGRAADVTSPSPDLAHACMCGVQDNAGAAIDRECVRVCVLYNQIGRRAFERWAALQAG
jgi:hypothetical protein